MDVNEIRKVVEQGLNKSNLLREIHNEDNSALEYAVALFGKRRLQEITERNKTKCKSKPFDKVDTLFSILECLKRQHGKFNLKSSKPIYLDLTLLRELKTVDLINENNYFKRAFSTVRDYELKEEHFIKSNLGVDKCDTSIKRALNKVIKLRYTRISASQLKEVQGVLGTYVNKTDDKKDVIDQIMDMTCSGKVLKLVDKGEHFRTSLSYLSSAKTITAERLGYFNKINFLKFYVKNDRGEFKEVSYTQLKYQKDTYIKFN